jgi:hypothetical protein
MLVLAEELGHTALRGGALRYCPPGLAKDPGVSSANPPVLDPALETGVVTLLGKSGSTTPRHGPANAFPSTLRTSSAAMVCIHTGSITSLFPRTLSEWSAPRLASWGGSATSSQESAISTRRFVSAPRVGGRARRGLAETLSSSRFMQAERASGRVERLLADRSRQSNVVLIWGRIEERNGGS